MSCLKEQKQIQYYTHRKNPLQYRLNLVNRNIYEINRLKTENNLLKVKYSFYF